MLKMDQLWQQSNCTRCPVRSQSNFMLGRGLMYDREGSVRRFDISPPYNALQVHLHEVLIPVCHRTTNEKGIDIDCRWIDKQTLSALQYNWIILFLSNDWISL